MVIAYLLSLGFGSPPGLFPADERVISIGAENRWSAAEQRSGLTEMAAIRPWPVLVLDSASQARGEDLALSFDEALPEYYSGGSRYTVSANPAGNSAAVSTAGPEWARMGAGAAFFSSHAASGLGTGPLQTQAGLPSGSAGPLIITTRDPGALFAPGTHIRDFSLEFWLYPLNMENGEQVLSWTASRSRVAGSYSFQRIQCSVLKNRLQWSFHDFFSAPDGQETLNITLNGEKTIVPRSWSHHLIRFDADTGLLEYLVDGRVEALSYATPGRTERGEVYTPIIGEGGEFVLGRLYTGLMDEFRIHSRYAGQTGREFSTEGGIQKYSPAGGRMETRTIDLGEGSGQVLRLETLGGRITASGNRIRNDYAGPGELRFADNSELQFFMRLGDNPYRWTSADWQVVRPWTELPQEFQGRYLQVAAVFYPSGDGETSPYLEELRIVYQPDEAPRPPARLSALARDGSVELSWRQSTDAEVDGYLVYYGTAPGEYFGVDALRGASPIDAGKHGTLRIEGLKNGTLYYFAVAAYRYAGAGERLRSSGPGLLIGEFSQEVTARPLVGYTLGRYE
ncbi:MAG: fibronectin type III domain-containing protein [Treponema sp.]|nr:fibronectin type III domain-containing protein [Treponema sp.]